MAWTMQLKALAVMMVVTGSINSLATKWADQLESKGSDGVTRPFEHPFLQVPLYFTPFDYATASNKANIFLRCKKILKHNLIVKV